MSFTWHIAIFACYLAAALGAVVAFPTIFPAASEGANLVFGVMVFLLGAVAHEVVTRRVNEAVHLRRMVALKKAYDVNREEMSLARDEVRRIFESLESMGRTGMPAPEARELREVASEVKVLHSLVEQLYSEGTPMHQAPPARLEPILDTGAPSRPKSRAPTARTDSAEPPSAGNLRVVSALTDEHEVLDIVKDGLRKDRVDLYLQPIVSLPQRKHRFFECFSRIRAEDGGIVTPEAYIAVAKKEGLITAIDNMLLFRSMQLLRKLQSQDFSLAFFLNMSAHSLNDRNFFRDFIDYLEKHAELAPNVVLELSNTDLQDLNEDSRRDLRRLSKLGYRFSLDGVLDMALDLSMLKQHLFDFVKIDANVLLESGEDGEEGGSKVRQLKQMLDENDIDLIVEKIETEQMLVELLDFNIDFGQGFLFGEPRLSGQLETAAASGD